MTSSPAKAFADLPDEERAAFLRSLSHEEKLALNWKWRGWWARPNQLGPPGDWLTWLILAGRGFGKSRAGAEWTIEQARSRPGTRGIIVAETPEEARDVMLEGTSGILTVSPPWFRPRYNPSKKKLQWPNGSTALVCSAWNFEAFRGKQCHWAWADELAKWPYLKKGEAWDQLMLGLRLPPKANCCVTTTPRPIPLVKELLANPTCVVTTGTTYENLANLADNFRRQILGMYEGTRLGRQELNAEVLEDFPGALWTHSALDARRCPTPKPHELRRVVVAIDPSGASGEEDADKDEQGIVAAGLTHDGKAVLLEDATCKMSPAAWGAHAVRLAQKWKAECLVWEGNFGGAMVEYVLRAAMASVKVQFRLRQVNASRGKVQRAEPVAALYEQGQVSHAGMFADLEDELCLFTPAGYQGADSPNRADALVWALTELCLGEEPATYGSIPKIQGTWRRGR